MKIKKQNEGFTLFEVLAVLTIIALFYTLVLQGVGESYQRFMERTDLQQIISDFQLLQMESILQQGYILQAVFFPVNSYDGAYYQLDFGFKIIPRKLKGLKLAGEGEKYIIFSEPTVGDSERKRAQANYGVETISPPIGGEEFFDEGYQASEILNKQEVHFTGSSGRKYQIFVLTNGNIEVSVE